LRRGTRAPSACRRSPARAPRSGSARVASDCSA